MSQPSRSDQPTRLTPDDLAALRARVHRQGSLGARDALLVLDELERRGALLAVVPDVPFGVILIDERADYVSEDAEAAARWAR